MWDVWALLWVWGCRKERKRKKGNGIKGNGIKGNGIKGNGIKGNGIKGNGKKGNTPGPGKKGNGKNGNLSLLTCSHTDQCLEPDMNNPRSLPRFEHKGCVDRRFVSLVGYKNPSVWTVIELLRADAAEAVTSLVQHSAG